MYALLEVMTPHRLTLVALSGAALNPFSRAEDFGMEGAEVRRRAHASYRLLVESARDIPRASQVEDLATTLYSLQLALVLFWLQDLSPRGWQTEDLLQFISELLERLRPSYGFPGSRTCWPGSPTLLGHSWERKDNQRQVDLQALKALRGSLGES